MVRGAPRLHRRRHVPPTTLVPEPLRAQECGLGAAV